MHDQAPMMVWRFKEWRDSQRFVIQVKFDRPEIVSMEQTYDEVQIRFINPKLFQA